MAVEEVGITDNRVEMKAFCLDMKTNSKEERTWITILPKRVMKFRGEESFSEEVYKYVYSEGTKRMRACIERIIPQHIQNWLKKEIGEASNKAVAMNEFDPIKALNKSVEAFQGIDPRLDAINIQRFLKKQDPTEITPRDIVTLRGIYNALQDKLQKPEDYFKDLKKEVKKEEVEEEKEDKDLDKEMTDKFKTEG